MLRRIVLSSAVAAFLVVLLSALGGTYAGDRATRIHPAPLGTGGPHCAEGSRIETIPGPDRRLLITTPRTRMEARWASSRNPAPEALFVISALDTIWDADGDPNTMIDTLVVPVGSTVRWQLVTGIHTLTNGRDSGDPGAGTVFSLLLDATHPTFDSTFTAPDTLDYFCLFHEPYMLGVLVIRSQVGIPGDDVAVSRGILRAPTPNPTPGAFAFSIALEREEVVEVALFDPQGRRVASVFQGPLAAGEHAFHWPGRTGDGRRPPAGLYFLRAEGTSFAETQKVSLVR